jgi:flavodoxin
MKSLLVVYSHHHMNTEKVAKVFAQILGATIKTPQQADPQEIQQYDLVGFGARIDSGKHYQPVIDFADRLPQTDNKKVFIFSTAALTSNKKRGKDHSDLREKLESKGYTVVDEFQCKGFNTNSFMRFFGGMNRGRPNSKDLKDAETFAINLKERLQTS